MLVIVISTHIEGFDPVSCGLLFWGKQKRGKSYENNSENEGHSIFSRISSKPFLVIELSIESLKQDIRIRESRKVSLVQTLNIRNHIKVRT